MINHIYDVSGDLPGNVFLIKGEKNFLFDTGMACCGEKMAERTEEALKGEKLDYVFLTHSHYDHVSGLPFLRRKWPDLTVYTAPHGKGVLEKESALAAIRRMNLAGAKVQNMKEPAYEDWELRADKTLTDGQSVDLGSWQVTAVETPGHTRDCLSYLVKRRDCEKALLMCCETAGVYAGEAGFMPCFLVGYTSAIQSIEKMKGLGAQLILLSHYGIISLQQSPDIWEKCLEDAKKAKSVMEKAVLSNMTEEEQIKAMAEVFWTEPVWPYPPFDAFAANMKAMLKTVRQETLGRNF